MRQQKAIISDIKGVFSRDKFVMVLFSVLLLSSLETYHAYIRLLFVFVAFLSGRLVKYADGLGFWLFTFSITYGLGLFLNSNIEAGSNFLGYLFCPALFYLFGKKIVANSTADSELTSFLLLCVFLFGLKVYIITFHDISRGELFSLSRFEETETTSATLLSATVSLGLVGLSAFGAFVRPFKNTKAWLYAFLFILSIIAVIHQISRTGLVIAVFCTALFIAYKLRHNYFKFIVLICFMLLIIWQLSIMDFFNGEVIDAYVSRMGDLDKSMGEDGGRLYRWRYALDNLFKNPGGWSTTEFAYVHNLWLDVQRLAGIVPFFTLLFVTFISIKNQIRLLSLNEKSFVIISIGLNVCMILTSFVEPILQADATYVYFMFLIWGMQAQYLNSYKNIDTNE